MSRELRNILYGVGGLLIVGGIVLAFISVGVDRETMFRTVELNCGSPMDPAFAYGPETPGCEEARFNQGVIAGLVATVGVLVLAVVAYLTYFAKSATPSGE